MNHDELQKLREEHNGAQQSVYRVLGNNVVSGGVVFRKETVEMEDEDGLRVIEVGRKRYILGSDWNDYLARKAANGAKPGSYNGRH